MSTAEMLTGVWVLFLLQITLSHSADDGCVTFTCPSWRFRPLCSLKTGPEYRADILSRNERCFDQDKSHEHHDDDHNWRHKRNGNNHRRGDNHGSNDGVFYTVFYDNISRSLTIRVWNGCQITLRVCQGTPTISTFKPASTRGPFPTMPPPPGCPPSMPPPPSQPATGRPTLSPGSTAKRSERTTKAPIVPTQTTQRPSLSASNTYTASTTKRPQVFTSTTRRPTTAILTTKIPQEAKSTTKPLQITTKWTKRQDISNEPISPKTTSVPQPFPSGESSDAEHVRQELRKDEDPPFALMIGIPVGLVVITALVLAIICLCRRGTTCSKEEKKTSKLSKGLSIVYGESAASDFPPSYDNPVYGKVMEGKSKGNDAIDKSSTTSKKLESKISRESSIKMSLVSDRIYEEIQNVRLNVHGTMSSTTSGLKNSKQTSVRGEPLPSGQMSGIPVTGYQGMKGAEYYYMRGPFL